MKIQLHLYSLLGGRVEKEQFEIKWLQKICNASWTFTQEIIPRQNKTFNLL